MDPDKKNSKGKLRKRNELGNNRFFNMKIGVGGAIFMSILVYFINAEHGFLPASIAAAKQAVYNRSCSSSINGPLPQICFR